MLHEVAKKAKATNIRVGNSKPPPQQSQSTRRTTALPVVVLVNCRKTFSSLGRERLVIPFAPKTCRLRVVSKISRIFSIFSAPIMWIFICELLLLCALYVMLNEHPPRTFVGRRPVYTEIAFAPTCDFSGFRRRTTTHLTGCYLEILIAMIETCPLLNPRI